MKKALLEQLKPDAAERLALQRQLRQNKKKQKKQRPQPGPAPRAKRRRRKTGLSPFLSLLFCSLVGVGAWQLMQQPFWQIQDVQLKGANHYNIRFVTNYLHNQQLKGKHLLTVNPLAIQAEFKEFPLIEEAFVERRLWPARLTVHIVDRKPLVRIYLEPPAGQPYQQERSFFVDRQGRVLPLPSETQPEKAGAFSLNAPISSLTIPSDMLEAIHRINAHYESGAIKTRGCFNLSNLNNIVLNLPDSPIPVWLGTLADLPIKISLRETLQPLVEKQAHQIRYIDLRFWKHPVLKIQQSASFPPGQN